MGQCHLPKEKCLVGANFFIPKAKFTTVIKYAVKSRTTPEAYKADNPYMVKKIIISTDVINNTAYIGIP